MSSIDRRGVLAAGVALTAVQASSARAAQTVKVRIPAAETAYRPAEVTVKVGDTIEWENRSIVIHTVTCDPAKVKNKANVNLPAGAAAFDSGEMQQDQRFTHTFTVPGTYKYFCTGHEDMGMVATVVATA